jgi:hypothetical protein
MMDWAKELPEHELQKILTDFHQSFSTLVSSNPGLLDKFQPYEGQKLKGSEIIKLILEYVSELAERRSPEFTNYAELSAEHRKTKMELMSLQARHRPMTKELEELRMWRSEIQRGFQDRMQELKEHALGTEEVQPPKANDPETPA